jgi:hypothetical protein
MSFYLYDLSKKEFYQHILHSENGHHAETYSEISEATVYYTIPMIYAGLSSLTWSICARKTAVLPLKVKQSK